MADSFDDPHPVASSAPGGPALGAAPAAQQPAQDSTQHPVAVFFHLAFKVAAPLVYFFTSGFVLSFVVCVLLFAFDFWTVKNVTGRILVGLRWWNEVKPDGTEEWIFETRPANRQVNPFDSMVFWSSLIATPLFWLLVAVKNIALFSWTLVLINAVGFVLGTANLYGYWKCRRNAGSQVNSAQVAYNLLVNQL